MAAVSVAGLTLDAWTTTRERCSSSNQPTRATTAARKPRSGTRSGTRGSGTSKRSTHSSLLKLRSPRIRWCARGYSGWNERTDLGGLRSRQSAARAGALCQRDSRVPLVLVVAGDNSFCAVLVVRVEDGAVAIDTSWNHADPSCTLVHPKGTGILHRRYATGLAAVGYAQPASTLTPNRGSLQPDARTPPRCLWGRSFDVYAVIANGSSGMAAYRAVTVSSCAVGER